MRKSNFIKGIVCGLMLTAVVGSAVYAGTGSYEEYGYNKDSIVKTIYGDAGRYKTESKNGVISTSAISSSSSSKLYKAEVYRKQYYTNQIADFDANSASLTSGKVITSGIARDCTEVYDKYVNIGIAYYSTSEITGIQDNYDYTIYQNNE